MTTKKTDDEKRMMLFDMQEHPERYTDEQMETLLADDGMKEFFHDMAMVRMAQQKAEPREVDVDEAWKAFEARHGKRHTTSSYRFKVVASIAGIIFLSSVAFAAIHSVMFPSLGPGNGEHQEVVPASKSSIVNQDSMKVAGIEKTDSLNLKPVVFDNVELADVMAQIAAFYHVKVEFANVEANHIRIFFNWDKTKTLQQNLAILNAFDRIQITEENGMLKVK